MPDVLFHIPTRVVFGLDAVNRIGQLVAEYGERAFLVTEAILYEGKVINKVQDILDKKGVQNIVFDEVVPNATSKTVDDGVTLARGSHADVVIGLGGVRTLSVARCIAMTAPTAHDMDDYLSGVQPQGEALPYLEVPTTCRNPFMFVDEYLMIDGRDRTGRIGRTQKGITKTALIDPKLSLTLPAKYTATTIMDTLLGCVEGLLSSRANFLSDTYLSARDRDPGLPDQGRDPERGRRAHAHERQQRGAAPCAGACDVEARNRISPFLRAQLPVHGAQVMGLHHPPAVRPGVCRQRSWGSDCPDRPAPGGGGGRRSFRGSPHARPSKRCGASFPPWAFPRGCASSTCPWMR